MDNLDQPLVTGKPDEGERDTGNRDVSSTTFVLTFAFRPEEASTDEFGASALEYSRSNLSHGFGQDRKHYFSKETVRSLYSNAKWFEIDESDWSGNEVYPTKFWFVNEGDGAERLEVEILPPRLVLFEWHDDNLTPKESNVLHTGFLLLQVCFHSGTRGAGEESRKWCFNDLLRFNETFRYTAKNYPDHFRRQLKGCYMDLINKLAAHGEGPSADPERLFFQDRWFRLLTRVPVAYGGKRYRLFPGKWRRDDLVPIADNRAFVWSVAMTEQAGVNAICREGEKAPYCGDWIRFVNVDGPGKDQPTDFEKEWINGRNYRRWLSVGTLYGFTSHSGVMVASRADYSPIAMHFSRQYIDMLLLIYYLRGSLYRFNERMVDASLDIRLTRKTAPEQRFEKLRREFAILTNLYQFPVLSNQQQGQEMYSIMRRVMEVDSLFAETATEIDKTHQLLQLLNDRKTQIKLNWFGGFIGGFGIITGVFTVFDAWLNHEDSLNNLFKWLRSLF